MGWQNDFPSAAGVPLLLRRGAGYAETAHPSGLRVRPINDERIGGEIDDCAAGRVFHRPRAGRCHAVARWCCVPCSQTTSPPWAPSPVPSVVEVSILLAPVAARRSGRMRLRRRCRSVRSLPIARSCKAISPRQPPVAWMRREQLHVGTGPCGLDQRIHFVGLAAVLPDRRGDQIPRGARSLRDPPPCADQEELGRRRQQIAGAECPGPAGPGLLRPRAGCFEAKAPRLPRTALAGGAAQSPT
jgi:hypothetical protein